MQLVESQTSTTQLTEELKNLTREIGEVKATNEKIAKNNKKRRAEDSDDEAWGDLLWPDTDEDEDSRPEATSIENNWLKMVKLRFSGSAKDKITAKNYVDHLRIILNRRLFDLRRIKNVFCLLPAYKIRHENGSIRGSTSKQ